MLDPELRELHSRGCSVYHGKHDREGGLALFKELEALATAKNNVKGFTVQAVLAGHTADFRPGMTVSIRLPLASATNAVSVPVGAVFESRSGKVVYVSRPDGTSEPRTVEVGAADLFHAEILSGLQEGESVLLSRPDDEKS